MIDRRVALGLGAGVVGLIGAVVWWLVTGVGSHAAAPAALPPQAAADGARGPVLPPPPTAAKDTGPLLPAIAPQGDGRALLRGIVLLPDGRPAAGVDVTLYRQTSAWPEWRHSMIDHTITGAAGTFQIPVDRSPNLLVGFMLDGYPRGLCEAPPSLPQLVLRLQQGFEVEGVVQNDRGLAMPNVRVALESTLPDDRSVWTAETNSAGRFTIREVSMGAMRVVARHEDWQPSVLPNVVVGVNRSLELRFERRGLSLEGRVVAAGTLEPIAGATVIAMPPGQSLGRNDPTTAVTRADGSFVLHGLAPGNLRLEVRHTGFATVARTVVVGPSPSSLSFDLPPRSAVRGHLRGTAGVAAAILTLRSAADEMVATTVQQDGSFDFGTDQTLTPGWATISVAEGRFAFAGGASVLQVQIEEGHDAALDLEIGPPAVVAGRVVTEAGTPISGARITARQVGLLAERLRQAGSALLDRDLRRFGDQLTRSASGGPDVLLAVTGADGTVRIAGLPPGAVSLRIAAEGRGPVRLDVDVPPCGETSDGHEVALSSGGIIRGQVTRGGHALPGAQVGVVVDGLPINAVSDIDGRYALVDLPAGSFRVRARYSTFPTVLSDDVAEVRPKGTATADLEFPPGRTVRGVVIGNEGQAVEGAAVFVRGEPGNPVVTDNSGAFAIEAPNSAIDLQIGFGDRGVRRVVPVAVDAVDVTVQIDAPPNCTIAATLLGLPGRKQLPGVLLRLLRVGGDVATTEARWIEMHRGTLRYPWFPAGSWQVTFWCEGYAPVVREIELQAGQEHSFGELLLEPGCELHGAVLGDQDRPVAGAEVFLGEESDIDIYATQTRSGADGQFAVHGVASRASTLVVRAPGYALQLVPLRLPRDVLGSEPLAVRLQRGSTIEVEVTGAAVEGSMVVLRRGSRVLATTEVGKDGKAAFANRGAGEYLVQRFGDDRQQARAVVERSGEIVRVRL